MNSDGIGQYMWPRFLSAVIKSDYRRLDWCSLPLIYSVNSNLQDLQSLSIMKTVTVVVSTNWAKGVDSDPDAKKNSFVLPSTKLSSAIAMLILRTCPTESPS